MRKTNAALLGEIAELEKACIEKNEILTMVRRERDGLQGHATNQNNEILWLKRIIEGLVSAPSVVTRPRG